MTYKTTYKGVNIYRAECHRKFNWYMATSTTLNHYMPLKADTLAGIKKLITQYLK